MTKRFLIVFFLGFSSGLPLALVTSTLQAWFSDSGMSIAATGFLSLLGFPYVYRFLWSPLLDRFELCHRLGKRRSWISVTQILMALGFNVLAWCSPQTTPILMALIGLVLASLSATQDTAIDAHRTEFLPVDEYAMGVSLAMVGYRLAMLLSGGATLIMATYWGWAWTYRSMGAIFALMVLVTLWSPEPSTRRFSTHSIKDLFFFPLKNLFQKSGFIELCGFIISYKFAESLTTTTSGIVMPFLIQAMHFPLETIGYVNKVIGVVAIVLGGILAGWLLLRWSIWRALMIFGLLQAFTNLFFIQLAISGPSLFWLILAVSTDNLMAGMGSTALVALLMRFVDKQYTASQLSMLVAFAMIPRVFSGPIGACLQTYFGWVGLYQIGFFASFLFIPFLRRLRSQI